MDEPGHGFEPMHDREPERADLHPHAQANERKQEEVRKLQSGLNGFFLPPGQDTSAYGPGRVMAAIEVPDADEDGAPGEPGYVEPTYFEPSSLVGT